MRAKLNGILTDDGGGLPCEVCFEWGLTNEYGEKTPWQAVTVGSAFSAVLTTLNGNQTYHYRTVARNRLGITYGNDVTFTSLGEEGMVGFIDDFELMKLGGEI